MKKKNFWFKKIMKIIGISLASVIGFVSASVGVYALFGGFKEKIIEVEGMNFEQNAYVLVGNEIDKTTGKVYDDRIKILPTNENATPTEVTLIGDANKVVLPTTPKTSKNLKIELIQTSGSNVGGEFELSSILEDKSFLCKTYVFIDAKISNFDLEYKFEDGEIITSSTNLYPGSKFKVSAKNIYPANALNKPSLNNIQKYTNIYGQDFFNKTLLFFSSNSSIAKVNMYTGEVEVKNEGEFTISAYYIISYEANKTVFLTANNDYNNYLDDSNYFCKNDGQKFESKSIQVAGLEATKSSFDLDVFKTYIYSKSLNEENSINLNINLIAPENSNFTNDQLDYKKKDIQIFEGYKENNEYYISQNQNTYFEFYKNQNPFYITIKPIDYSNLVDHYIILRIGKEELGEITSNIKCENDDGQETGEWVYYAFVKVNTIIVENSSLTLKNEKILASFSEENPYLTNNEQYFDLNSLLNSNLPENATYSYVRYFVKDENKIIDLQTTLPSDDDNEDNDYTILENEVIKTTLKDKDGKDLLDKKGNKITGYFLRANKEGEIKVYAKIYKTTENGDLIFTDDGGEKSPFELISSNEVIIIVSKTIEFSDVQAKTDKELTIENGKVKDRVEIFKGKTIEISFNTSNPTGFNKLKDEFFKVDSTNQDLVSINYEYPTEDNKSIKLILTATNKGEGKVTISFNNKNIIELNLLVSTETITKISLKDGNDEITNSEFNFVVSEIKTGTNKLVFNVEVNTVDKQNVSELTLPILVEGGKVDSLALSLPNNYTDYFEIKIENDSLVITPKTLCNNMSFYIYDKNSNVKSKTYTINISTPDNFAIVENYKNKETISLTEYEKVIGGENFDFKNEFLTIENLGLEQFSVNCLTKDENNKVLYDGTKFLEVMVPTVCEIALNAEFINNRVYKTYHFYILPRVTVTANSISVDAGDDITLDDSIISAMQNSYDNNDNNKIKQDIVLATSVEFYKDDYITAITQYSAPANSLDDTIDYINYKVTIDGKEFKGKVIVNITSHLQIQNKKTFLYNGKVYELVDLFNVYNNSLGAKTNDTISKVVLTIETANYMQQKGIVLLDKDDVEINTVTNNTINSITKIFVPEDFNLLSLNELKANVTILFTSGEIQEKNSHLFNLDFELTTLTLDSSKIIDDIIYITNTEKSDDTTLKNLFIKTANTLNKNQESAINKIDEVNISFNGTEITFALNGVEKTYNYVILDEFASQKTTNEQGENIERIIGKAYNIFELINLNSNIIGEIPYSIKTILNEINEENGYVIQSNGKVVVFEQEGIYKIKFEVLGRELEYDYKIDNLDYALTDNTNIYSNISYKIFNNKPDLDIQYSLAFGDENYTNWIVNDEIVVPNYNGEKKELVLSITFGNDGYTKVTEEIRLNLHRLIIETKFDNVDSNGKQILYKGLFYNLSSQNTTTFSLTTDNGHTSYIMNQNAFYTISTSDNLLNLEYNIIEKEKYCVRNVGEIELTISLNGEKIKTIQFISKELEVKLVLEQDKTYFKGQKITYSILQDYVLILDSKTQAQLNYKDKLVFENNGIEIKNTDDSFDLESNAQVGVFLGEYEHNEKIIISPSLIEWRNSSDNVILTQNLSLQAYSGTRVSNFISCLIQGKATKLTLNYKPGEDLFSTLENNIYSITTKNGTIVKLNAITGEVEIPTGTNGGFSIVSYIVGGESETKTIEFIISELKINENGKIISIYAGNNTTDITQFVYYTSGVNKYKNIDFSISEIVVDQNGYSHSKNNITGEIEILKNGQTVGKIGKNENCYLTNFVATNNLDTMAIKLKGILRTIDNQNITILNDNYIEITLQVYAITVTFDGESISVDGTAYNVLDNDADINFAINPIISNGENTNLSFDKLTFESGFIGNPKSQYSTLQRLELNSDGSITLPSGYSISVVKGDNGFKIVCTQKLIDYVFLNLDYTVGSFTGKINIALKPTRYVVFYSSNQTKDQDNEYYADIYSPSIYTLIEDGLLFGFSNTNLLSSQNVQFAGSKSDSFGINYSKGNHYIAYSYDVLGSSISLSSKDTATVGKSKYIVRISLDKQYYYYTILVTDVTVQYSQEQNIPTQNCDLKTYINLKINGTDYSEYTDLKVKNTLKFALVSTTEYSIDEDGNFYRQDGIITEDIVVNFSLLGKVYSLTLKKSEINSSFYYNDNLLEDEKYSLKSSTNYYIYPQLSQDKTKVSTYLFDSAKSMQVSNDMTIYLKNVKYSYLGTIYSLSSETVDDAIEFSFAGETMISLSKYTTHYLLSIKSAGNLTFDIASKYSSFEASCGAEVSINSIKIEYTNPSVIEELPYQNLLSGESLDLSNLVIKNGGDFAVEYELSEYNRYVSIQSSTITAVENIKDEQIIKVKVSYGNSVEYINLRIIPKIKVILANNNGNFYVLKGEKVNITKYARSFTFIYFDAKNEPVYNQNFEYKKVNNNATLSDVDYLSFEVTEAVQIKLYDITFTLNPSILSFDAQSIEVGETLKLSEVIKRTIDLSNLTLKDCEIKFNDANGLVSTDGNFVATYLGDFDVFVTINGVEYKILISVTDLKILVSYNESIILKDNQQIDKRYENIFATQKLNVSDYVNVQGNANKTYSLVYGLEILDYKNYNQNSLKMVNINNAIYLKNADGENLLMVSPDTIECFVNLKSELLVSVVYSIENNGYVTNNLNLRLMPITLKINSNLDNSNFAFDKSYISSNGFNLINNVANAYTICDNYNIYLNDKINFEINSSKIEGLGLNGQNLEFGSQVEGSVELKITIGENDNLIQVLKTIYFKNQSEQSNELIFSGNINPSINDNILAQNCDIIAIYKSDEPIFYNYILQGTDIIFDVYDKDAKKVLSISSKGKVIELNRAFKINVEATNSKIMGKQQIALNGESFENLYTFASAKTEVEENGISYIEFLSEEEKEISLVSDCIVESAEGVFYSENKMVADNVSETTYGYFVLKKGNQLQKIYVKIYPFSLNKTYIEDYVYTGQNALIDNVTAISNGEQFKNIFISDAKTINLNDYCKMSCGLKIDDKITFSITKCFVLNSQGDGEKLDGFLIDNNDNITLKNETNEYFIKITANFKNKSTLLNFRIIVINVQETTFDIETNSIISLNNLINTTANVENMEFRLIGSSNSYIENNNLYFNEPVGSKLKFIYSLGENEFVININAKSTDVNNRFCLNGTKYEEYFYNDDKTPTNIFDINKIESIVLNDTSYSEIDIESKIEKDDNKNDITVFYLKEKIKISQNGDVQFYDSVSKTYINQNNIGIFFIFAVQKINEPISYSHILNIKLNNYDITNENGYVYKENGVEVENKLKFSLVYEDYSSSDAKVYKDDTNTYMKLNGIILNVKTGETSGEYEDSSKKVFIKVYVDEDALGFGTKFKVIQLI